MRKLAISMAAALAILLLAVPREAGAIEKFNIDPEKKLAKKLEDTGDVCFECGDIAKGKGLYRLARSYFSHALEFDIDHKKTRKVMGFERKKGKWVLEEDMVPPKDIINENKRAELEEKLRVETLELRRKAAEDLWAFVANDEIAVNQRMLALYHVIRLYPEGREAQKAARSSPDYMWYKHQLDDESDTNRIKWIARAPKGEVIEENTPYEKASGLAMKKRKTDWIVFHADVADKSAEWAETLIQFTEASRDHAFEILGVDKPAAPKEDAQRLHYTVIRDRERFAKFVENCSGITDPTHRKEAATISHGTPTYNPYGAVWLYPSLENDYGVRDGIAHDVASKEIFRLCGPDGAYWLARGLGYINSTHMNGSTSSIFYGVKMTGVLDTGGAEALPGFGNSSAGWRVQVGMELVGGTEIKLSHLVKLRVGDYSQREMAHAFCYTDYLLHEHKDKLNEFLQACYEERARRYNAKEDAETAADILQRLWETLVLTEDQFMEKFRVWAQTTYFELPSGE
ncbi:MAG: hypothetical protein K8I27_12530 [Planctomycetes bacterium]|nr:hypothetical protein [Planctomycetota bacterium]